MDFLYPLIQINGSGISNEILSGCCHSIIEAEAEFAWGIQLFTVNGPFP